MIHIHFCCFTVTNLTSTLLLMAKLQEEQSNKGIEPQMVKSKKQATQTAGAGAGTELLLLLRRPLQFNLSIFNLLLPYLFYYSIISIFLSIFMLYTVQFRN
ncbi:hypothetical protein V6Z11_D06G256200 [Gossypium hirsutum]